MTADLNRLAARRHTVNPLPSTGPQLQLGALFPPYVPSSVRSFPEYVLDQEDIDAAFAERDVRVIGIDREPPDPPWPAERVAVADVAGLGPDGEATVLLSHHPDVFRPASERGIDLQISGHTHGGQIRFGPWAPVSHSKYGYVSGLFERADSRLYVSRGVGVSFAPLRFGAPPEVPTLTLRTSTADG